MARLQIEINDKLHRVVYIDYDGGALITKR